MSQPPQHRELDKTKLEDQPDHIVTESQVRVDAIKDRLGVSLDELFDGFRFVRKDDDLFVFSDGLDEIKFTLMSVKQALTLRVEEDRNETLLLQLREQGLFRVTFTLPSLSLFEDSDTQGMIEKLNESSTHAIISMEDGSRRKVHISLLRDLQSERLIRELKEVETGFLLLTLAYSVKRIREISEQLFHPCNESARVKEAALTLSRIRRLLVTRLDERPEELRGLKYGQLTELLDELEEGLAQVGTGEMSLITLYMNQLERIGTRIKLLGQSEHLNRINEDQVIALFSPDQLRDDLIEAMIKDEEISQVLRDRLSHCIECIRERSDRRFMMEITEEMSLTSFVESLFELQAKYINTQLRIGRLDFSLIRRFKVLLTEEGDTAPILRDYDGITTGERLNLYRELVEHRLNLLFSHQIVDQKLREHAHYSVKDFYKVFYKLTNQA